MDRKLNENKHGYVIQYFADKGYGFIAENKTDDDAYFFHISNLEFPFEIIPLVTRVEFNLKTTSKGLAAVNIKKYIPIVDGTFGNMQLPYTKILLSNKECYGYINTKQIELQELLNELTKSNAGINVSTLNSGWISINITEFLSKINDIKPDGGKWKEIAPSGYPDTFEKAFDVLQNQINYFNKQYIISKKGYDGENKTDNSLKSISINYPILHNVLLEEGTSNNKFSAETDTLIITDKGIFIIETKNYGGKRDIITISNDGRWSIFDGYKKTSHIIANNPYKQTTDHIFVIKKFLEKNKFNTNLALIPIIAISNDNVELKNFADANMPKVIRADMVGTYVLNYLNTHESAIDKETMSMLKNAFTSENLPPKKYLIIDYFENIKCVCKELKNLLESYLYDLENVNKQNKDFAFNDFENKNTTRRTVPETVSKIYHSELFSFVKSLAKIALHDYFDY